MANIMTQSTLNSKSQIINFSNLKQVLAAPQYLELDNPQNLALEDGRARTGNVLTVSGRIITTVIGVGILTLPWAIAGLGWLLSAVLFILLCSVTVYTSNLLSHCYLSTDPVNGNQRNYTYMDAVRSSLGATEFKICGFVQLVKLVGAAIGYTTAASASAAAIQRSFCFRKSHGNSSCYTSPIPYTIGFGFVQMFLSQIHGFQNLWWLPILAGLMSSTYSLIGLGLSIAKVAETRDFKGGVTGESIGTMEPTEKVQRIFQAIGNIAFAFSHPVVLIEIQDTIKSPPSETRTMQKATLISYIFITLLYVLCGSFGYAAFGDSAPGNLLTSFSFHNLYWLLDIANVAVVIHLVVAYQGLVGRTTFVFITTLISLLIPFFNTMVGLLGALGFWPLTVYFPVEMYIVQKRIQKWSMMWIGLQILSVSSLVISVAAAIGSIAGVVDELKSFKPFKTSY